MGEKQHNRFSIMNFGKEFLDQDEKQFEKNNTWVPITPEKPMPIKSNPVSDWPANQMRRPNYQEFPTPGSDCFKEKLLHYHGLDQNLHLIEQTSQTGESKTFDCYSADRNTILNHIASSYTQGWHFKNNESNSNALELLKNNSTNAASANRNLDARNSLLPKFYPQARSDVSDYYTGVQRCNIYSASDTVFKEANRFMISSGNSEFTSSNSNSLPNNRVHCSAVPNQLECMYSESSETLYGDTYPDYDLNYVPIAEVDATASFTNFLQSISEPTDQLKFVEDQFCTIPDYTITESTSQVNDQQKNLVAATENEIQEYNNGLLQQIVDSSSAAISTTYGDQKGSDKNICGMGNDQGFDLNKTPEQKTPRRRKHRPKVIVEAKPKRSAKPATQKTQNKENTRKRKKNVPKSEETTQTGVMEETADSTVAAKKSCRKVINFDLENTEHGCESRIACQQEVHHRNEKGFNTTSDHKATEMLGRETITYGTNSALLISQNDALAVENQQTRKTHPLHEKLTNSFPSERKSTTTLSPTTEHQQTVKFSVNEKGPAQGYYDLCQEGNYRCMQQYIHANSFQPEPYFENFQKTQELIYQDTLPSVPNILNNCIEAKGSKRKYCKSTESQQKSSPNPLSTSLNQEILQAGGNSKGASPAKGLFKNQKNKKTQNRYVSGRSSGQIMPKENSKKASKDKDTFQPASNENMSNRSIQSNRFVELQNAGASSGKCFDILGEPHQIYSTLIDEIVSQLNVLNLGEGKISEMEGQMALVPYNGAGSIVPFQESELAKKQKPRPKVDLDQETERTWKLLMGKEGSKGLEGIDKDREKWWEEERNVFHGRVDSFIARMHLILGDRRFSKWKGSVVDSVIGVFLTQNVSDHLSSSAFMSLTARFPLKSESTKRSYDVDTNTLFEAELCMVNSGNTITSYGIGTLKQPTFQLGFETPHHTRALWRGSETTRTKGSLTKANNQSSEEELLSSQDSLDSSITQDTRIRSTSASNSESEGFESRWEPRKTQFLTSTNSFLEGKATMFQDFYSSINGVSLPEERTKHGKQHQVEPVKQNCRVDRSNSHNIHSAFTHPSNFVYQPKQLPVVPSTNNEKHYPDRQGMQTFQINGGEFSWTETVSVNNKFQENSYRRYSIGIVGDTAYNPTEMLYGNETLESLEFPSVSPYEPSSQETSESENRPSIKSINTFHILGNGKDNVVNDCSNIPKYAEEGCTSEKIISAANWQGCSDNSAESEPEKPVYYPSPVDKMSKFKVPKAKKTKLVTEKKHAEDWDMLRKQVRADGIQEERSTNTMDSLDYEAVRCASVKEISDSIKERGMNNMLAERIKDFLNRLVTDHGSIDLEWLRHVPPDRAKDYLLSIRGLGLKSVECVRLLTLHHMAFPVDTNVGRIAVRLGWVPLQPLPETLQIHLLELYPVLESVQKYLWPRLCKLDQRTLYELHYQMITFGKVFCTKKKPNCNACPMRAECRHFASAFASARLALPGPEEKQIVSMHVPISAEKNSSVNTIPMILPLPEYNLIREISPQTKQCEPIIEEPATPEQEWTEDLESDIEDFYREDEDEDSYGIPIIEVNIKELAMNVQNHLQEYGEHNEGDLSKALVALTPQSASIPTPKLKNVSRLRTEHQVYELPDSHPLLEKMDKREPDDPSPYLLAIWIPGETANSVEPPERRCGSEDSTNLCNDKTCFSCNSIREANSQTVRGTILIPCRTANRGSFPLNGTYFQVNEVFADHASSIQPIDVPRAWIWNLPRRTVYFGTSVTSIFKGLSTQEIQHCFWRGFVCVRGFDQHTHAPRPLSRRLHYTASRLQKTERRKQE